MIKTTFRTYSGLAGDLHELLIAKSETGVQESKLIDCTGWFRYYKIKRAKKRLLKLLELRTGKTHIEK
jgi:hypothetical protein